MQEIYFWRMVGVKMLEFKLMFHLVGLILIISIILNDRVFENLENDRNKHSTRGIYQDSNVINEFFKKQHIICMSFPTNFFFGYSYRIPFRTINYQQHDHLLHQYTQSPAINQMLLFTYLML